MTIKRTDTHYVPFMKDRKISITREQKPGSTSGYRGSELEGEEGKSLIRNDFEAYAANPDRLEVTATTYVDFLGREVRIPEDERHTHVYEREKIKELTQKGDFWRSRKLKGNLGQDVDYNWEPTLPPQARK